MQQVLIAIVLARLDICKKCERKKKEGEGERRGEREKENKFYNQTVSTCMCTYICKCTLEMLQLDNQLVDLNHTNAEA